MMASACVASVPYGVTDDVSDDIEMIGPVSDIGTCAAWIVRCRSTGQMGVFKPAVGEGRKPVTEPPGANTTALVGTSPCTALKRGVKWGDSARKEVAAFLLDHEHSAGVPATRNAVFWLSVDKHLPLLLPATPQHSSREADHTALVPWIEQLPRTSESLFLLHGSVQAYVAHAESAEDYGSALFRTDEVHRIGILDVRLLNLDRHLGNLLVVQSEQVTPSSKTQPPHLVPIDHGYCLPSFRDLSDVRLEWCTWRQCREPFSADTLAYIGRLNAAKDAALLRDVGIDDEAIIAMVMSTLLLQEAASKSYTLADIASMVQRVDDTRSSLLEKVLAQLILDPVLQQMASVDSESIATTAAAFAPSSVTRVVDLLVAGNDTSLHMLEHVRCSIIEQLNNLSLALFN